MLLPASCQGAILTSKKAVRSAKTLYTMCGQFCVCGVVLPYPTRLSGQVIETGLRSYVVFSDFKSCCFQQLNGLSFKPNYQSLSAGRCGS